MYLIVFGSLSNCLGLRLDRFLCRRIGVLGYCGWSTARLFRPVFYLGVFGCFALRHFISLPIPIKNLLCHEHVLCFRSSVLNSHLL